MDSSLGGQVALVIGASSGIGRAIAAALSAEGVSVMAAARREQQLQVLQTELAALGRRCSYTVADVTNPRDMQTLVDKTVAEFGKIDLMVYATGTNTPDRSLLRLSPPLWDEMLQANLSGAYYITSCVLPWMRQAGAGHLIYVSSIGGLVPDGSGAAYQASKRGLLGLAHAIRFEEKKNGIRTCVICPGMVETALLDKRPVKPAAEELTHALQPVDIAHMVVAVAKLPPRATVPEIQILPAVL